MRQKIILQEGVCVPSRMQPFIPGAAQRTPSVRVSRLKELLKTKKPRLCVVRGEGIGDVLTATPTVTGLREAFPTAEITFATNTRYLGGALVKVLQYNPDINQIIERELLNEAEFDLTINLHCPAIGYEKRGNPPISRIDLFARHAGVDPSNKLPRYYPQKNEIEAGEEFLRPVLDKPLMMVQPSASEECRSLDHGKLKKAVMDLYKQHSIQSVIVTHSGDFKTDTLWDNVPGSIMLKDADTREIAGVMVHCNMLLCPDSSLMHLAAALGVPTVAYFGPTHPAARVNHYPKAVAIWQGESLAPCPCWYEHCPINQTCWSMITSDMVVEAVSRHLQRTKKVNILQLLRKNSGVTIQTEII